MAAVNRFLRPILALALTVTLAGTLAACDEAKAISSTINVVSGSGKLLTKDMGLNYFTAVEASNTARVEIIRAEGYSVSITADDNLFDYLEVAKQGQTLRIGLKDGSYSNITLQARMWMPSLSAVKLSGASTGTAGEFGPAPSFSLDVSGASKFSGQLQATDYHLRLSGASNATLSGTGNSIDVEASGASRANLQGLSVAAARVKLSGASNATVDAKNQVAGELSGASHLTYAGAPRVEINSSGASSARAK